MTSAKYFDAISLVVTHSHSWSLVVTRGLLVVTRGHSWSTRGHSWSFVVTRGHSWSRDDEKVRSLRDDLLNLLPVARFYSRGFSSANESPCERLTEMPC